MKDLCEMVLNRKQKSIAKLLGFIEKKNADYPHFLKDP